MCQGRLKPITGADVSTADKGGTTMRQKSRQASILYPHMGMRKMTSIIGTQQPWGTTTRKNTVESPESLASYLKNPSSSLEKQQLSPKVQQQLSSKQF